MSDIERDTYKMSESVQTETITKDEKTVTDSPLKTKRSIRHRKAPSVDLKNVSILHFFKNLSFKLAF